MNYLILSPIGLSLFIVPRLGKAKDVEKIFFCVLDPSKKDTGKEMDDVQGWEKLEIVTDYQYVLNRYKPDDLIVFIDDVGAGETGEALRRQGYKVIGGSPLADKIEEDRDYATEMMSAFMDIPETYTFDSFEAGIQFAKTLDKDTRLVFKPNDASVPKEYTYNAKNINDLISAMKDFKDEWKWKESFQLQYFVKGKEVDFNAYFNGKEYLPNSMFIYFENKPMMNDDVGPATGGAVAVQFARKLEGIFFEILEKMKPKLIEDGYVGQLAINSIISEENHKPHFLEFCGRVGYPSFPMDITALEDNGKSLHDLFMALASGTTPDLFPTNKIMVTISIGVPPYPLGEGVEDIKGLPIKWSKDWDKYFFPYFIMNDEKKGIVAAGVDAWLMQITCADTTLDGAVAMLYDTYLPTLQLKNALYRTDLGKSAKERMKAIREWKLV